MGPVMDLKGRKDTTMEASTSKNHKTFARMPKDKTMRQEINHEHKFDTRTTSDKQDLEVSKYEDMNVDIINCTNDDECASIQPQSEDATVSSSSFSDTFSDAGNRESDDEVESELRGFGGSGDLFPARKKRLTSHWRKYIQPLMWRCKWVELQIKKFQSQAIKYNKELEKDCQAKQLKYENFELNGLCSKSMPFIQDSQREKPMKRKIRKRNEESDAEVFMSQHNLFSFLATDRSPNDGATMDDDQTNPGNKFKVPDDLLSLNMRDDYSMEQMLWKIEVAQSQVIGMKTRINTVMTENAGRFSSAEDLSLLESKSMLPFPVTEPAPPINRDGPSAVASLASQLMKFNTDDDLIKPEVAAPIHGEGTDLQKDATEHMEQPPVTSRKRSTEGILIYNRRAKKPQTDSGGVKIHPIKPAPISVSVSEDSSQNEEVGLKLRSISQLNAPKNKKKRAARVRRKSGSSLWSRRNSG